MPKHYFKFKQFSIYQKHAAMKVGTDGVLLGAWANAENARHILDIGTGTGLITLMLAQRSNALIDAVEVDENAVIDAKNNFEQSNWKKRIRLHFLPIQSFESKVRYDLIVSNPPYFSKSQKAGNISRTTARHNDTLNANDLLQISAKLLSPKGKINIIIPTELCDTYKESAQNMELFCNKLLWIKPTPTKNPKRVLMEFSFQNQVTKETFLIVEDKGRHQYSDSYKELTNDFYLAF